MQCAANSICCTLFLNSEIELSFVYAYLSLFNKANRQLPKLICRHVLFITEWLYWNIWGFLVLKAFSLYYFIRINHAVTILLSMESWINTIKTIKKLMVNLLKMSQGILNC